MPKVTPETKAAPKRRLIFSRTPGLIDRVLNEAQRHLAADAKQADIPKSEQEEDAALVAKLKAAQAPAKPKRQGGLLF